MKELTIEQKAKAYDEALKVLHKYDGANIMFPQSLKEEMFPELRENEDEKIRKALIDGFTVMKESKNCGKTFSNHNIPVEDILNWLKKQALVDNEKVLKGARKDVALSIMNFLDRNTLGKSLSDMERGDLEAAVVDSDYSKVYDYMKKKLDKQGEHDVNKESFIEGYKLGYREASENIVEEPEKYGLQKQGELKPIEWGEEDGNISDNIINLIVGSTYKKELKDKYIAWLKSIKDRPQPKQVWSEEDDGMLQTVINRLELSKNGIASEIPYVKKCVNWLKSIKDKVGNFDDGYKVGFSAAKHNQWKPSKEQITWLYRAADVASKDSRMKQILNELLSDLKKLNE